MCIPLAAEVFLDLSWLPREEMASFEEHSSHDLRAPTSHLQNINDEHVKLTVCP